MKQNQLLQGRSASLSLRAETFDLKLYDIPCPQVLRRLHTEPDSRGRARGDEITRLKRHKLRNVVHEKWNIEDHGCRVAMLALLAVDAEAHRQVAKQQVSLRG